MHLMEAAVRRWSSRCLGRLVAAAGVASTVLACGDSAPSPTVSLSITPAGQAVVGVTQMRFVAESSDGSGAVTYDWTFGDGGTATGRTVEHVFDSEGAFDVAVTIRDGRGRQATASARATARSLTGNWQRPGGGPAGVGFQFSLRQTGADLEGQVDLPSLCPNREFRSPPGTIRGTVSDPRAVTWTLRCVETSVFTGAVDAGLDSITGSYGTGGPLTYLRR